MSSPVPVSQKVKFISACTAPAVLIGSYVLFSLTGAMNAWSSKVHLSGDVDKATAIQKWATAINWIGFSAALVGGFMYIFFNVRGCSMATSQMSGPTAPACPNPFLAQFAK